MTELTPLFAGSAGDQGFIQINAGDSIGIRDSLGCFSRIKQY